MTEGSAPALRLLCVAGSLAHGGAERHAVTLVNGLAARGHECHLAYVKDASAQLERLHLGRRGSAHCLRASRYADAHAVADLAALMDAVAPTVVLAQNPYALAYASLARLAAHERAPVCATFHSNRLLGAKEQLQMAAYRPLYWTAACTVFVCEAQRRRWRRLGVLSRRNEVIHNGVDVSAFAPDGPDGERAALRRALGLAPDAYVVGITAGLRPEKNHLLLVEAIALLRARGIRVYALLVGDGEMRPAIEARVRQLGLEAQVRITGFRQDVRPYVRACDTMALPSVTEALPLAAIEALALGRPVVLSDVGGAAEIVEPGVNGLLFPSGDREALAERLHALADPALRERMGREARRIAVERFREDAMIGRYERLLTEIAARSPARAPQAPHAVADAPAVLLLGPALDALSGVSAHLRALLGSSLATSFGLRHFQVGSEGRAESVAGRVLRLAADPFRLAAEIRRTRARIVHVNSSLNLRAFWRDLACVLAARACGARVVYQVHGGALPQDFCRGFRPLAAALRRALALSHCIVVLARSELEAYRRFLPGHPVVLAPNAVPCAPLPPRAAVPAPRDPGPLRLAFIGRLAREKGVQDLLQALAALRRSGESAELVIAGAGPEEARLRRLTAELELGDAVRFAGPVTGEAKAALLAHAEALVLPSHAEGLPYALLEGMAAGKAVIATRVGAIPDVVTGGVHGCFVPVRDPAALADALAALARDRARVARMGESAHRRVRECYSIERLAGRLAELYRDLDGAGAWWPSPTG